MAEVQPDFALRKILEVKQRIQTIVVYEELPDGEVEGITPARREVIVDSFDRPMQAQYT